MSDEPTIRDSQLGREIAVAGEIETSEVDAVVSRVRRRMLGAVDASEGAPGQRFVILRQLGVGGCGRVYLAYDTDLDRRVALKQLLGRDEVDQAQLVKEAQLLAQVRHPHIVNVHDITAVSTPSGSERLCIIMEFVEGETLRQWLNAQERSQAEVLRVMCEAGRGLAAAHEAGIIHRDFKPDNVLIDGDGRARVLDFGLSQGPQAQTNPDPAAMTDSEDEVQAVRITGTPSYMAPERFLDPKGDVRSDIFSFAATLWEGLTGVRPFRGKNIFAIRRRILEGALEEVPRGRRMSRRIERIVRQGLATDPEQRHGSMPEILAELERDPWRRLRFAAAILGALLVCGALVILIGYATRPARIEVDVAGPWGPVRPSAVWVDAHPLTVVNGGAVGDVAPGVHRLRVEAAGMLAAEDVVELERGATRQHSVVLSPQQGTLNLEAAPTGASVSIDGVEYGSRLRDHELDIGEHHVRVHLLGHYDARRTIDVAADSTIGTYLSLTPALRWSRRHIGIRYPPEWIGDLTGDGRPEVGHRFFNNVAISDPWNDRELWKLDLGESVGTQALWFDIDGDGRSELISLQAAEGGRQVGMWSVSESGAKRVWHQKVDHANKTATHALVATRGQHPDTLIVPDFPPGVTVAIDLARGETLWQLDGARINRQVLLNGVEGPWIVQQEAHRLRALDAKTGTLKWATAELVGSELLVLDIDADHREELLVTHPDAGTCRLLAGDTGMPRWELSAVRASVVTFGESGAPSRVLLFQQEQAKPGNVALVDAFGEVMWSREMPEETRGYGAPATDGWPDMVLLVHAGGVEFVALETGEIVAEVATSGTPSTEPEQVDWDGDGRDEWLLGCADQTLVSLRPDVGVRDSVTLDSPVERLVSAGDVDADGFPDLLLQARGPALITAQRWLWWQRAADGLRATPQVADFDGDGSLEVAAIGDFDKLSTLNLFDAKTGRLENRATTVLNDSLRRPLPVPDARGGLDLLVVSGRSLSRYSGRDARMLAKVDIPVSYTDPLLVDVERDGEYEVVTVPWNADDPMSVHRLHDLSLQWTVPVRGDGTWAPPAVFHQPDGQAVFVLGLHNGDLVALRSSGELWRLALDTRHFYPPVDFDIDLDGEPELLTEAAGQGDGVDLVAVRRSTGEVVRRIPGMGSPLGRVLLVPPEFAQPSDGANSQLLVVATVADGVVALTREGEVVWRFTPTVDGQSPRGAAPLQAADLDGNGELEVLAPLRDGTLYVLDGHTGELQFRVTTGDTNIEAAPVVADLDGNGTPEVILAGHDRNLLVIRPPRGR